MSKSRKITFNMIAADMKKVETKTVQFSGVNKEFEITVKPMLSCAEMILFSNIVMMICINPDTGLYAPEAFDFAVKMAMLVCYAGFDIPKDIEKAYAVIYGTGLVDAVRENIDIKQFCMIRSAVEAKLDHMRDSMVSMHASQIGDIIGKMNEVLSGSAELQDVLSDGELLKQLEALSKLNAGAGDGDEPSSDDSNIVVLPVGDGGDEA